MRWHHRLYVSLRGLFGSSALDRELNEELQFHFDRQVQANIETRHDAGAGAPRGVPSPSATPIPFAKRRATGDPARGCGSSVAISRTVCGCC